jgi:hypothetical protein
MGADGGRGGMSVRQHERRIFKPPTFCRTRGHKYFPVTSGSGRFRRSDRLMGGEPRVRFAPLFARQRLLGRRADARISGRICGARTLGFSRGHREPVIARSPNGDAAIESGATRASRKEGARLGPLDRNKAVAVVGRPSPCQASRDAIEARRSRGSPA